MERLDGRQPDQLRKLNVIENFVGCAEASYLIEVGRTRVLCNATVETEVPRWLKGTGKGWVTAEYSLLPRSTSSRVRRERGNVSGRTQEIQRLIGRSLRGVCNLAALGERQVIIDCDVLEADGGTRTASVVGGFLALAKAMQALKAADGLRGKLLNHFVTAVSVGVLNGIPILDLCYAEDSAAEVDMNVVMTDTGDFVEIQGTGEEAVFSRSQLDQLLALAEIGCLQLKTIQERFLGSELP